MRTNELRHTNELKFPSLALEDDERMDWLSTAVTNENEARVHALMMKDHHMSIRMLADELNMGEDGE